MPGFNPFRYRFPYTNLNDINLDWLIKKVRKLSEDVAEINPERMEEVAQQAAAAEQTAQNALETAEGVSGIAADAETIARAAQTTANSAADSAQAAGTAAAAAQTTANNAADSAQAAGTAAAAAQTTANQNRVAIAIVANGDTAPQNILKDQYVIWNGALYTASSAIASGATLSSSNLSAAQNGGLNDLKTYYLNHSLPSKIVQVNYDHPSFHIPNNCRAWGAILDSSPSNCGLYAFVSYSDGAGRVVQFSTSGPAATSGQNAITFSPTQGQVFSIMCIAQNVAMLDDIYQL